MKRQSVYNQSKREDLSFLTKGDILGYRRQEDNAPHHMSFWGKVIDVCQKVMFFKSWMFNTVDPSVTHLCLVQGQIPEPHIPAPGHTSMFTVDAIMPTGVIERSVEHNYQCRAFHLRDDFVPHENFTSQQLREKAVDIALLFLKLPYNRDSAVRVLFSFARLSGVEYTQWLVKHFKLEDGVNPTPPAEGLFCVELALCSFQIAYLLMAGEQAKNEPLPAWLDINARSSPAHAIHFLSSHPEAYKEHPPESMLLLRYEGTPHVNDLNDENYQRRLSSVHTTEARQNRVNDIVLEPEASSSSSDRLLGFAT